MAIGVLVTIAFGGGTVGGRPGGFSWSAACGRRCRG